VRSRRAQKPSRRAQEAAEARQVLPADEEGEIGSDEFVGTPPRAAGQGKRGVPATPDGDSLSSVASEPELKARGRGRGAGGTGRGRGRGRGLAAGATGGAEAAERRGRGRKSGKPPVTISQAAEELLVRAQMFPNSCLCELAVKQPAAQLKALARRIEDSRRRNGDAHSKYPVTRVDALTFICPVHLADADGVSAVINRDLGPKTTLERIEVVVRDLVLEWDSPGPDGVQGGDAWRGLSVASAYIWFMRRVLVPARFVPGSPEETLFLTLLPHLVRDLVVNHSFHIVHGFRRIGARGTRQVLNGLDNLAEFSAIMLFCVAHYTGDHQECGLTRTDFGACVESVNIAQSNVVVTAAMDAITKVVTFVASHRVTDVGIIYPNQHVLMNFFGQLYVHVY
jgi:hypothetical protein